jgi:hypothetical protein
MTGYPGSTGRAALTTPRLAGPGMPRSNHSYYHGKSRAHVAPVEVMARVRIDLTISRRISKAMPQAVLEKSDESAHSFVLGRDADLYGIRHSSLRR